MNEHLTLGNFSSQWMHCSR